MRAAGIVLALTLLSMRVNAEIEKTAMTCGSKICFYWWPKVPAVKGGIRIATRAMKWARMSSCRLVVASPPLKR